MLQSLYRTEILISQSVSADTRLLSDFLHYQAQAASLQKSDKQWRAHLCLVFTHSVITGQLYSCRQMPVNIEEHIYLCTSIPIEIWQHGHRIVFSLM